MYSQPRYYERPPRLSSLSQDSGMVQDQPSAPGFAKCVAFCTILSPFVLGGGGSGSRSECWSRSAAVLERVANPTEWYTSSWDAPEGRRRRPSRRVWVVGAGCSISMPHDSTLVRGLGRGDPLSISPCEGERFCLFPRGGLLGTGCSADCDVRCVGQMRLLGGYHPHPNPLPEGEGILCSSIVSGYRRPRVWRLCEVVAPETSRLGDG